MIVTAVPRPAGINTCLEPAKQKKKLDKLCGLYKQRKM